MTHTCPVCQKTFSGKPCRVYCSLPCKYIGVKRIGTCEVCKSPVMSSVHKHINKFCSKRCLSIGQSAIGKRKTALETARHKARRKPTPEQRARLMLEYVLEGLSENRTVR